MHRLVARGLAFACVALFASQAAWAQPSTDAEGPPPVEANLAATPEGPVEHDPVDSGPTDSAPVPPPAVAPPTIVIDEASEQRYRECLDMLVRVGTAQGQVCLQRLVAEAPGTSGALQAAAALYVTRLRVERELSSDRGATAVSPVDHVSDIAPGRLGIGVATGLLAVFTAVNGGVLVGVNSGGAANFQMLALTTGAAAVVLGAVGGFGGYLLGEQLQLDEADARLIGSSLVWGSVVGGHLGMVLADSVARAGADSNTSFNALLFTFVGTTWVAGAGATAAATYLTLSEAQVGLINSGGMLGATWSPGIMGNLNNGGGYDARSLALGSVAPIAAGLVAGGVLGALVPMSWGEVLICDLGGVLGLVAGGALMLSLPYSGSPMPAYLPPAGALIGWSGTAAGVVVWRHLRGESGSPGRSSRAQMQLTAPVVLDRRGAPVPALGVIGAF